jgi:predicted Zn-dependent protease
LTLTQVGRFPEALRSLDRALELDPFNVAVHAHVGRLSYFRGDFDRALVELRRSVEIDYSYLPGRYFLAMAMVQCGDAKEAAAQLEDVVRESQEHPAGLSGLAYAQAKAGKHAAALATMERLHVAATSSRVPPYFLAFAEAGLERSEKVLEYLEQAYTERFGWLFYLKMEPAFDWLRMHPHFKDLMQRVQPTERAAARSGR